MRESKSVFIFNFTNIIFKLKEIEMNSFLIRVVRLLELNLLSIFNDMMRVTLNAIQYYSQSNYDTMKVSDIFFS